MTAVASIGRDSVPGLLALRDVIRSPLAEIATRLSTFLSEALPHSALIISTRECTGRPHKVAGQRPLIDLVTAAELNRIKVTHLTGAELFCGEAQLGGQVRSMIALLDASTDMLFVLATRSSEPSRDQLSCIAAIFGIVATSIQHQVVQASPAYLAESRAASSERARAIAQMADSQSEMLTALLATLRSRDLDDRRARAVATETASNALIALWAVEASDRDLAEESIVTAFERSCREINPLLRNRFIATEYVHPADGQSVPGEVAHAARAVARTVALAYASQYDVDRVRVAWECDGTKLMVDMRDNGRGEIDKDVLAQQLRGRVRALGGDVDIEVTTGWGSRVSAVIPLHHRREQHFNTDILSTLNSRELEVLGYLAVGKRNKVIADALTIGESTVKFHVAGILKKLGVGTRGEAGALALQAGIAKRDSD